MDSRQKPYYEVILETQCAKVVTKCKICKKEIPSTSLLNHLANKTSCRELYSPLEIKELKDTAKLRHWATTKSWKSKNLEKKKIKDRKSKHTTKKAGENEQISKDNVGEDLSEYEKLRLGNIEQNKMFLKQLQKQKK